MPRSSTRPASPSSSSPAPVPLDTAEGLAALSRGGRALMAAEHLADGINQLLEEIGPVSGASRVWLFQLLEVQPDAVVQDYVAGWASEERYRQLNQRRFRFFSSSLDDPVYRRLVEERQLGRRHDFCVPAMPKGPLRANLEGQLIQSMATVPIFVHGQWWGTLGIDDCERPVSWEGPGLDLLEAASQLIAAAIYRYQLNHRSRQIELFHKVANCGVWEVSLRNGRVWCSRSLKAMLGYLDTYPRLPLRRLLARLHPRGRAALWSRLRSLGSGGESDQFRLDVRLKLDQAGWVWHELIAEVQRNELGQPVAIAGLLLDISRRKRHEERALDASRRDALTGALNRRGMAERLRAGGEFSAPDHLLLLDIDHFKRINDTYGHPVGDSLLKQLVQRLRSELRADDILVRLGGEEFAVLLDGMRHGQALALAERLRRCVADEPFGVPVSASETPLWVPVSISLGLARRRRDDGPEALAQMMGEADQALYAAKGAGRNCVQCFGTERPPGPR